MFHRQAKILVVDDNKVNVELIRAQLKPYQYEILTAYDGEEAIAKVLKSRPDLVLLDLMMPKVSGYEVCKAIKQNKETHFIPIIVITALQELDDKLKAIELGADDFLVKPFNKLELTTRIKSLLRMKELHDDLETTEDVLFSLAQVLEAKDPYTRGHSERVARYATGLAKALALPPRGVEQIRRGALLHDIGKIGVREEVLSKPGRLTPEEMEHVKTHPARGYDICSPLKSLAECLPCIRHHHERFDGNGYPDKLVGDKIPLKGMITSIADTYDAITTNRPYRKGRGVEVAIATFEKELNSGQWNPEIVKVFIDLLKRGQPW